MITQEIQRMGVIASAASARACALERYYENPSICLHCGRIIPVRDGQKPSAAKRKKFCNHSCSAIFNNHAFPKRIKNPSPPKKPLPRSICAWHLCNDLTPPGGKFCSKKCSSKYHVTKWRKDIKEKAVSILGGQCKACGYNRCNSALVFHHKDPSKKDFAISSANVKSWDRVEQELSKCVLLCANCHRELHAGLIQL